MSKEQSCASCLFWRQFESDKDGFCRRNPPSFRVSNGSEVMYEYPETSPDEWCGQWKASAAGGIRKTLSPRSLTDLIASLDARIRLIHLAANPGRK